MCRRIRKLIKETNDFYKKCKINFIHYLSFAYRNKVANTNTTIVLKSGSKKIHLRCFWIGTNLWYQPFHFENLPANENLMQFLNVVAHGEGRVRLRIFGETSLSCGFFPTLLAYFLTAGRFELIPRQGRHLKHMLAKETEELFEIIDFSFGTF